MLAAPGCLAGALRADEKDDDLAGLGFRHWLFCYWGLRSRKRQNIPFAGPVRVSIIGGKMTRSLPALSRANPMQRFTLFWSLTLCAGLMSGPIRAGQPEEDEETL